MKTYTHAQTPETKLINRLFLFTLVRNSGQCMYSDSSSFTDIVKKKYSEPD